MYFTSLAKDQKRAAAKHIACIVCGNENRKELYSNFLEQIYCNYGVGHNNTRKAN